MRAGDRVGRGGPDHRHHAPLGGAVDHLGLHADAEPVQRRRELLARAGIGVEPRVVADAEQAEGDVELAVRRQQQGARALAVDHGIEIGRHQRLEERERIRAGDEHRATIGTVDDPGARAQELELVDWRHQVPALSIGEGRVGRGRGMPAAAVSNARALFRHSRSSSAATESATIPAPACTLAWPLRHTMVRIAIAVSRLPEKSM